MSATADFGRLAAAAQACTLCAGADGRRRVLSEANGPLDSPLLFVAEAPGRDGADRTGVPLYGDRTGDNYARLLAVLGWRREQVFITNAVLCNPRGPDGRNRPPKVGEQRNCAPFLRATIDVVNPRYVVSLGRVALEALGGIEAHGLELRRDVGRRAAWYGRALVPLYHPSPRVLASHRDMAAQEGDYRRLAAYLCADGVYPPGETS
ncbi:MAG: uracil-DNA glycosylase [Anaerolineae bacterium]|nr:uracil-DNA glycosylase [Anaerolineae bacterium]